MRTSVHRGQGQNYKYKYDVVNFHKNKNIINSELLRVKYYDSSKKKVKFLLHWR